MSKRLVIDLDDTICFPNHKAKDSFHKYRQAKPNKEVIDALKLLHSNGWYIIIHTARRMVTHKGDVKKIIADVGALTKDWLEEHEVPYNELVFGKPYGDIYVDDKNMKIWELIQDVTG